MPSPYPLKDGRDCSPSSSDSLHAHGLRLRDNHWPYPRDTREQRRPIGFGTSEIASSGQIKVQLPQP